MFTVRRSERGWCLSRHYPPSPGALGVAINVPIWQAIWHPVGAYRVFFDR
jgi:hypothetical protein